MRLWLHPAKLIWNLRIIQPSRKIIFQTSILVGSKCSFSRVHANYTIIYLRYSTTFLLVGLSSYEPHTPIPVDHPRKQIFLLRDLDVSCWSHGSDVPGQIENWEKKTWEKKNTFICRWWLQIFYWNFHPYIWGLQQKTWCQSSHCLPPFAIGNVLPWKTTLFQFCVFFCVSLKKIARSCRLLIMSDNMQLQLALFNAQRRFWISFGQMIPRRVQPQGSQCLVFVSFSCCSKTCPSKNDFFLIFFRICPNLGDEIHSNLCQGWLVECTNQFN